MSTFNPDGAVTINDSGADVDFRVESDGNTHMLFVDGGNNRVGICGSVVLPTSILEVSQDVSAGSGINSLLTISATDGGVNMSGGEGPGILFRIPDDETNPSVGAQIGALKEHADDSISNTALSFSVSQNDETLDEAMHIDSEGSVTINSGVLKIGTLTTAAEDQGFNFDSTGATTISCTQNTAVAITTNLNASGMLLLNDTSSTGATALVVTGGGVMSIADQTGSSYVVSDSPSTSQTGIYLDSNKIYMKNGTATTANMNIQTFRTRNGQ